MIPDQIPVDLQSIQDDSNESQAYIAINRVALRLLNEKYTFLIAELPSILLDCQDCRSYDSLAQDLIPEEYRFNPVVAKKIIHFAVQHAVQIHNTSAQNESEYIDLDARSSRVRSYTNTQRNSGHAMLESIGRFPFSTEQIVFIRSCAEDPEYQWQVGPNAGRPNWSKVTIAFNNQFATQRTAKSLSDQIKTMRYNGDPRLESVIIPGDSEEDTLADSNSIFYIERFLQRIIIENELYERFAVQIAYILNDLTDLRSYHEIVRDLMPDEYLHGYSASSQIVSMLVDLIRTDKTIDFNEELFRQRKIVINVHRKRIQDQADEMLERQGIVRFTTEEFRRFMELRRICIREDGPQAGRTNYLEVAEQLNIEFHAGSPVRTPDKLSSLIRTYRQNYKHKPYMYPDMDDYTIPIDAIVAAYRLPEIAEQ